MKGFALLVLVWLSACNVLHAQQWRLHADNPGFLHRAVKQVTDVIVHDVYSPPVAGRTYAYISVAAYEALRCLQPTDYYTLAGQLKGLQALPLPDTALLYSYNLAAVQALLLVAKSMVVSEEAISVFTSQITGEMRVDMPEDVFERSIQLGTSIAAHVLAWSSKDNYKETRGYPKYAVKITAAGWKPTPPAYMKAVEPYWNKIRTMVIDSASQFKPKTAIPFSTDKKSRFYKEAIQVKETVLKLTEEQRTIAHFWDCNPFKMNINGHVMFASKKISPGGHWINIAAQACKQQHLSAIQSAEVYARLSLSLADAFSCCWDEKYRSQVIRPETYINQYIDANWMPVLQTPPFPEYTSGHSVLSSCAAVVLSTLFGDHFAYTDDTEVEFKLAPRSFRSFKQAASEAAISRLYGGIHYMTAITNGLEEGERIGVYVDGKLKTAVHRKTAALK